MQEIISRLEIFLEYAKRLDGNEKSEAQVFCDRLFQAFGHDGYKEAGAELEHRIKKRSNKGNSFADLVWKPILLLEMKKRGVNLYHHYNQAFQYWINAIPNRPRYVVLCNFDQFWIYDFDKQVDQPVDKIAIEELPKRYTALNFLFPNKPEPVFGNDMESVSRDAANNVAKLFNSLISRGIERKPAQRFVLQILVAMFGENVGLLPVSMVYKLVKDCLEKGQNSYDLFGALFLQMNNEISASGGRYRDVPYFNGGIFQEICPLELNEFELKLVGGVNGAATKDWSKVNPSIFGAIFQQSMDADDRHAFGAHYTSEADILRIVTPTVTNPWREKIAQTNDFDELLQMRQDIKNFKVLDPACGSGNFLYLCYREIVRVEIALMTKLRQISNRKYQKHTNPLIVTSPKQLFGIDQDSFGVELAKVTLMIGKKLASDEAFEALEHKQYEMSMEDSSLPLDNLDPNFLCGDALFLDWPEVDAIIGNPPFQSKNKMISEFGRSYANKVRKEYQDVPAQADYCVYWFRKSHDHLRKHQRAGLVGTNTIRQNYSREGSLDYITSNDGTITEAVASQVWSGDAKVHVSIVNWVKGTQNEKKTLYGQTGTSRDSPWKQKSVDVIGPSLSFDIDVSVAKPVRVNKSPKVCFQGQTHGHKGFLLDDWEAVDILKKHPNSAPYLHPFLISNELFGTASGLPTRFVIDFGEADLLTAQKHKRLMQPLKEIVLPARKDKAADQEQNNLQALESDTLGNTAHHHLKALDKWWMLFWPRCEMIKKIGHLNRYLVVGRVSSRTIIEFVSNEIHPNDSLTVFALDDDYSFGILQSDIHVNWHKARCSTLGIAPRYTSNTVFDSFPWPQTCNTKNILEISKQGVELRNIRSDLKTKHGLSLRDLYKTMELPGKSTLRDAHDALNKAVRKAYGMKVNEDSLAFLLKLNELVRQCEKEKRDVIGPGLPKFVRDRSKLVTEDCVRMNDNVRKLLAK